MSINKNFAILFIAFISVGFVSSQCPLFTDPKGNCVEECQTTQFKDPENKKCLSLASDCKGVIYYSRNLCIKACPKGTTFGYNKVLKTNVCIDYDVATLYPYSLDIKCGSDQVKDLPSNTCISTGLCKGRAIIELNVCISECPKIGYIENSYEVTPGTKIMICSPESFKPITPNTCMSPKVVDRMNNECLLNQDYCTGYYDEQGKVCTVGCGGYSQKFRLIEKDGKKICVQCQFQDIQGNCLAQCPSGTTLDKVRFLCLDPLLICTTSQTLDLVTPSCLGASYYCKYNYVKATNTCQSSCPQYHIVKEQQDPSTQIIFKTCVPCRYKDSLGTCYEKCPSNYTIDETKSLCIEPPCVSPKVKDLTTNLCLDGPEQCKAYFVKATLTCQAQCPEKHVVIESQYSTSIVKTCNPCQFKDLKGNCYETCPVGYTVDTKGQCIEPPCVSPKVKDLTTNVCLDGPEQCKAYFVKATLTCQAQCPEKHIVIESQYSTSIVKTCNPCQFKDLKGNCFEKCPLGYTVDDSKGLCIEPCNPPKVKNLINNECLQGPEQCRQFFVKATSTCQSACPDNHISIQQNFGTTVVAVCTPCFFKDIKGNCYEKCPLPLIADTSKGLCIEQVCVSPQVKDVSTGDCLQNIEQCKFFYLKSQNICIQQCPSGYTVQEVQNAYFKICIPCNFKDIKGTCYEKCPDNLITDPTNKTCVEPTKPVLNCKTTQIRDLVNNICLDSPAQCKNYFIKEQFVCLEKCPEFYSVQESNFGNNNIVKQCIPCYFKDEKGNCFSQCPSTMRVDQEKRLCIADPILSCTGYYVKTTGECLNTCPFGFQSIENTKPRTCIPCDSCSKPEQCTKKLSSDKKTCSDECPLLEIPQTSVSGQTYVQCQKCPNIQDVINKEGTACQKECKSEELFNPSNRRCINRLDCTGFAFIEGLLNICGRQCPSNQISTPVPNYKYQQCTPCKSGEYVNISTNKCITKCNLYDSNGVTCLNDIKECKGFINLERTLCLKECPANLFYISNSSTQNQIVEKCPYNYYSYGQLCTQRCPSGTYGDQNTGNCLKLITCQQFISFDGQSCIKQCPYGQFPQTGDQNLKFCKVCNLRLSSNGQTCSNECGPNDIFDTDLKQCLISSSPNTCYNKIYSSNKKECSSKCPSGQLILTNSDGSRICLKNIEECKDYISSDFTQCVKACYGELEAAIQKGTSKVCIKCPYGPNSDKTACSSYQLCDSATQKFDLDLQQCVLNEYCKNKYTSTDGKKCSLQCVYPDVSRQASSTQCFQNCEANETYIKEKGCVAPNSCSNYVASDGKTCVEQCIYIKEAIDESASNPKRCKKCKDNEISVVIESNNTKIIQCQAQLNDTTQNTKKQADSLKTILDYVPNIQPEQKNKIQDIIVNVAKTVETSIKTTDKNLDLTVDQRQGEIKNLIQTIRDVANTFVQKIEQVSVETYTQISLGQSEFQLVAEKKRDGLTFKVSFSIKDFFGATSPSLQTDPTQQSVSTLTKTTNAKIETLSALNIASNPYCTDKNKCSSTGLFIVDYTISKSKRILAAVDETPIFQLTYDVDSSKINKLVCVSYDEQTGNIQPAVQTTSDVSSSQVTCSFLKNSDLYYDSECQFIDKLQCNSKTNPDKQIDEIVATFSNRILFQLIALLMIVTII